MSGGIKESKVCNNPVKIGDGSTLEDVISNMKIISSNFRTAISNSVTKLRKDEIAKIESEVDKKKITLSSNYNIKIDNLENKCIASCSNGDIDDKKKSMCITSCQNLATKYTNLSCERN